MPRELAYGTESVANEAIGGVPTIHYFDFKSRGRGQVVRLLLIDAGAAYKDIRYSFEEWPEHKRSADIADMNPAGNVPIIEMSNGKILTQSYPILRRWARQLDAYDGKTEDEKYWVDAICDIVVDWRTLFIAAFFASNKQDYEKHKSGDRAHYLRVIEQKLRGHDFTNRGPYIVGADITYADLVLYQICHDEGLTQNGGAGTPKTPSTGRGRRGQT